MKTPLCGRIISTVLVLSTLALAITLASADQHNQVAKISVLVPTKMLSEHEALSSTWLCAQYPQAPKQVSQTACKQAHYQSAKQVDAFMDEHPTAPNLFHYQRCQSLWLTTQQTDFIRLARCMGLPKLEH